MLHSLHLHWSEGGSVGFIARWTLVINGASCVRVIDGLSLSALSVFGTKLLLNRSVFALADSYANDDLVFIVHSGLIDLVSFIVVGWFWSCRTCCKIVSHLKSICSIIGFSEYLFRASIGLELIIFRNLLWNLSNSVLMDCGAEVKMGAAYSTTLRVRLL